MKNFKILDKLKLDIILKIPYIDLKI